MLAVVQNQQHAPLGNVRHDAGRQRRCCVFAHAQDRGHGGDHALDILQRRQIDEPHTIGKRRKFLQPQLLGEARLAAAADARQRQQRCRPQ